MENKVTTSSVEVGGKTLTFETGRLAHQSDGSVLVTYGDTAVLASAMMSDNVREGIDFFPLVVDFEMKYYASGKIKGSRFMKREGRASDSGVLSSRLIDRPIRPMFPKNMRNEVQIVCTLLQTDGERSPAPVGINAASIAIQLAGMPLEDAVGGVRVGMREDGEFFLDPTYDESEKGKLDLVVAGTEDAILMVEAGSELINNEQMIKALDFAHQAIKKICKAQKEFVAQFQVETRQPILQGASEEAEKAVSDFVTDAMLDKAQGATKHEVKDGMHEVEDALLEHYADKIEAEELSAGELKMFLEKKLAKRMRQRFFETGKRIDGREADAIRPLHVEVGVLPRLHGSALFQRGETQALSILTMAGPDGGQLLDDAERAEYTKNYMHHYNFPPYSVGEIRPMRGPGRREIGHGMLAERALERMIPSREADGFPYTMRVVSEILSCNGSSSMASVCGSTLALMDGGVPLKRPIAGIAMGLLVDDSAGKYHILTDIQGFEDFDGDMDFKVTGDEEGITALQLDIKIKGLKLSLLEEALTKAQVARKVILEAMKTAIPESRKEMNRFAPRIDSFHINPDYIKVVIGKGGETIQGLTAQYGVEISIEDDGLIMITSVDQEKGKQAREAIEMLVYEPKTGDVFEGTVKTVTDFGAFVEYLPGKEALVHISAMADHHVKSASDIVKEGDRVKVKVMGTDKMGRTQLSMKDVKDKEA